MRNAEPNPAVSSSSTAGPASISVRYLRPRRGPVVQIGSLAGYEWNRVELTIPAMNPALTGLRIVHLTDLHLRKHWPAELGEVVEKINADPPDLVCITGDFVDDKNNHQRALPVVEKLVRTLQPRHGVFAVVGNHDGDLLAPRLASWGVNLLMHRRAEVSINGATVELIGLPGPDRVDFDERFVASQPPRRDDVPRIVLCHYPDLFWSARPLYPDLYLAGHTHGGQICLPSEKAIITHDRLARKYAKGAHAVKGTCLVVGRGFGFTTMPVRVNCPAEVIEVVLKRET